MDEAFKYYLQHKKAIDKETDRLFLHYQPTFAKTYLIADGVVGCAQYLALLAYPSLCESSHRIKYFSSMVSAYCRIYDNEMLALFQNQSKEFQEVWQIKNLGKR